MEAQHDSQAHDQDDQEGDERRFTRSASGSKEGFAHGNCYLCGADDCGAAGDVMYAFRLL